MDITSTTPNRMFLLGQKYMSDKITHHQYHKIYDFFLQNLYDKKGSMVEIGVQNGYSIQMWLELFPYMYVHGVDINNDGSGDRFTIHTLDQSNEEQLNQLAMKLKMESVYFINDDGSHIPEHQLLTFNILFPLLQNGGVYIMEDIETSYWTKGDIYGYPTQYGYKHPKSIVEIFKDCADIVNREYTGYRESPVQHHNLIDSITFSKNCIIIVKKYSEPRPYIWADHL